MTKKAFFQRRSVAEIRGLNCEVVDTPEGLVSRIENLDPENEGLIIDVGQVPLTHPSFTSLTSDLEYASRMALRGVKRKGDKREFISYVPIQQPRSVESAIAISRQRHLPFKLRNKSLFEAMRSIPEGENFYVGYMFWPILGNNKSPILVPYWALCNGTVLDAYSQRICKKLPFNKDHPEQAGTIVERNYAPEFITRVPSTEDGKGRYLVKWHNVPIRSIREDDRAVIGWSTRPAYGRVSEGAFEEREDLAPMHEFFTQISHEGSHRRGESFEFTLVDPHAFASWSELLRFSMREGDYSPWDTSQYALLSRLDAAYWNKENNNLLVREKNTQGNYVFKHPRIDQLSVLFARHVGARIKQLSPGQVQETMYWDPERDGKIGRYPVLPGEK
ncbi:MAG: hypothetical protein WC796_03855 [Candidatus Pacearchaeota archaeon]